jgi:uncharacterized membrane protein
MTLGTAHLALAVIVIASGACVVGRRKGDLTHRRSGWLLAGSLLGVNVTALFIYNLTGEFGAFHVFAIVSLTSVLLGVGHARLRRPERRWRERHAYVMTWTYVGLLSAAAAEVATRLPETSFWWMVLAASGAVLGAGGLVITRQLPRTLRRQGPTAPTAR